MLFLIVFVDLNLGTRPRNAFRLNFICISYDTKFAISPLGQLCWRRATPVCSARLIWVGAHFLQQPSLLLQCLALILFALVEFQTLLKDCLQRLLADVKIDAFARLRLLLLLNFAHEFMIAGFYCSDW